MKREIKFRRWVKSANKMIQAEDIYKLTDARDQQVWGSYFNPDNVEFMQYTGLKDKNGREIYDGDIVSVSGMYDHETGQTETDLCEVRYNGPSLMYVEIDGSDETSVESLIGVCSQDEDAEVIGNIHENPELLKP